MSRISTERSELEFTVTGEGEPVLMIHGGGLADTFDALCAERALADNFKLIRYHRYGYGRSSRAEGPYGIANGAADAADLLREADSGRGHIVSHSLGGPIALQLALDHPEAVQSLTLLEAGVLTPPLQQFMAERFPPFAEALAAGDKRRALDAILPIIFGEDCREILDSALPDGWYEQGLADVGGPDLPALQEWAFGEEQARQISQPVLLVLGAESPTAFAESHSILKEWFPQADEYVLPRANHLLQMANPGDLAARMASFLSSHPIGRPAAGAVTSRKG
jgi:pimeloyl-ACP methyl ester carboxylesterase